MKSYIVFLLVLPLFLVSCSQSSDLIIDETFFEKIDRWSEIHLNDSPTKVEVESFIETAVSSMHPINGNLFNSVDTVSYTYP